MAEDANNGPQVGTPSGRDGALLRIEDVASLLQVDGEAVKGLVRDEGLPAHELPGDLGWVFVHDEVIDWVRARPLPGSRQGTAQVTVDYDQPVWDSEQVAHVLRMNIDTVRRLSRTPVEEGGMPAHRLPEGRSYKYLRDEILEWVASLGGADASE